MYQILVGVPTVICRVGQDSEGTHARSPSQSLCLGTAPIHHKMNAPSLSQRLQSESMCHCVCQSLQGLHHVCCYLLRTGSQPVSL